MKGKKVLWFLLLVWQSINLSAAEQVVPDRERKIAQKKLLSGPSQSKGVKSVSVLGTIPLHTEFSATKGKQFRARVIVIEPGGVVAVHQHESRPGMAYILEGEIYEYRNGSKTPSLKRAGDTAFEKTGVSHWWENRSQSEVRALVVDIVDQK